MWRDVPRHSPCVTIDSCALCITFCSPFVPVDLPASSVQCWQRTHLHALAPIPPSGLKPTHVLLPPPPPPLPAVLAPAAGHQRQQHPAPSWGASSVAQQGVPHSHHVWRRTQPPGVPRAAAAAGGHRVVLHVCAWEVGNLWEGRQVATPWCGRVYTASGMIMVQRKKKSANQVQNRAKEGAEHPLPKQMSEEVGVRKRKKDVTKGHASGSSRPSARQTSREHDAQLTQPTARTSLFEEEGCYKGARKQLRCN
jgi:hypothetical protein